MRYNFDFTETEKYYHLKLNKAVVRAYAKSRHSKQEAEELASDVVSKSIKLYGMTNVNYNGNLLPAIF